MVERIAALTYLPVPRTGEATQITEYAPGEYYDFHWDTNLEVARLATFLLYISDVQDQGGETAFPLLTSDGKPRFSPAGRKRFFARRKKMTAEGRTRAQRAGELHRVCSKAGILKIAPKKGRAVFWFNFDADGELEPNSLHGSCPNGHLRKGANAGVGNWRGVNKRVAQTWIKKFIDFNAIEHQQDGAPSERDELERAMVDMAFETDSYDRLMNGATVLLSAPVDKHALQPVESQVAIIPDRVLAYFSLYITYPMHARALSIAGGGIAGPWRASAPHSACAQVTRMRPCSASRARTCS